MISGKKVENSYPFYLVTFPTQGITNPEWKSGSVLARQGFKADIDAWNEKADKAEEKELEKVKSTPNKRRKTLEQKPAEVLEFTPNQIFVLEKEIRVRKQSKLLQRLLLPLHLLLLLLQPLLLQLLHLPLSIVLSPHLQLRLPLQLLLLLPVASVLSCNNCISALCGLLSFHSNLGSQNKLSEISLSLCTVIDST